MLCTPLFPEPQCHNRRIFTVKSHEGEIRTDSVEMVKESHWRKWKVKVELSADELRGLYPDTFRRMVARLIWDKLGNLSFMSQKKWKRLLPATARIVGASFGLKLLPSEVRQSRYWPHPERSMRPIRASKWHEEADVWEIDGVRYKVCSTSDEYPISHFRYKTPIRVTLIGITY